MNLPPEAEQRIKDMMARRREIIEQFVEAFLACEMPDDATPEWIVKNCELCENQEYKDNQIFTRWWIQLKGK